MARFLSVCLLATLGFSTAQWLAPVAGAGQARQRQVTTTTVTSTTISTLTITSTINSVVRCARLVNVTGTCQLRRGILIDKPEILSLDDEGFDDVEYLLNPSPVHLVEVTPLPVLNHSTDNLMHTTGWSANLESTMGPSRFGSKVSAKPEMRIYYTQLVNLINIILGPILPAQTSTQTLTSTSTRTSTTTTTVVSYRPFFIQRCTPSPFLFTICP